jgi:hypothetical protein
LTHKRKPVELKLIILSALVVVLALIYILTLVLNPENRRSDAFAWFDSSLIVMADGIEISGPLGAAILSRKNDAWIFNAGTRELPVKQSRVDDFFTLLSRKDIYPLRAVSSEAAQRLGLTGESAARILIRGGAGLPLLDLLVGGEDALGKEVYLKWYDRNQIYSGTDQFSSFTNAKPGSWYNLRLFDSGGINAVNIDTIQQAEISFPGEDAYIFRRGGGTWIMQGNENAALDPLRVESWLRSVVEAEGEDFASVALEAEEIEGSINIRLGDGTNRTLQIGPEDEQKNRNALVSDSSLVYIVTAQNFNRIFRGSSYFLKR